MQSSTYVLITAARNEERHVRNTLQSVVDQTCLPKKWVIVSDGSTDLTDQYVRDFASRYSFIQLLRLDNAEERSYSNRAVALNVGYAELSHIDCDYVGVLDADISLPPNYYEELITSFHMQPRLGIAGGVIVEDRGRGWQTRYAESGSEVAGAIQFFRRTCYEDIGGYMSLKCGGPDVIALTVARQKGWQVRTFMHLRVCHHRRTGTAGVSEPRAKFRQGVQDYFLGYHPVFELGKCFRRILEPPYGIGSLLRLCGYLWPRIKGERPAVPADFLRKFRQQQMRRLLRATRE